MLFQNILLPVSFFAASAIASPLDPSAGVIKPTTTPIVKVIPSVGGAKPNPELIAALKKVHEASGRVVKGHQVTLDKQAAILRLQADFLREHGKKLDAAVAKVNASFESAQSLVTVSTATRTSTVVVTPTSTVVLTPTVELKVVGATPAA